MTLLCFIDFWSNLKADGLFLVFRKKFELVLPDHWMTIIQDNPQLFSIVSDSVSELVYPNIRDGSDTIDSAQQRSCKPDELVLPWTEKHWNVYITSISSTVEVWGRLIGPDYSVRKENRNNRIEIGIQVKPICF